MKNLENVTRAPFHPFRYGVTTVRFAILAAAQDHEVLLHSPMSKDRNLTDEQFNKLLNRLDPIREQAEARYLRLHRFLVLMLSRRHFVDAEDMADEVMNRVAANPNIDKAVELKDQYFFTVARNLMLEQGRRKQRIVELDENDPSISYTPTPLEDDVEGLAKYECLMGCLQQLNDHERGLILSYYQHDGRDKINHRQDIAAKLKLSEKALRVRVYRIRRRLEKCLQECLEEAIK